jgi:hypothetical protein
LSKVHKDWEDALFNVQVLEGHNDYITDVDCGETVVISGRLVCCYQKPSYSLYVTLFIM